MSQPSFKVLPRFVLDPEWITAHPAFSSSDPDLVRASIRLLHSAYIGDPPGSVGADVPSLAQATRLPEETVARHLQVLTSGFTFRDGRLFFEPMARMLDAIEAQFHDELSALRREALSASLGLDGANKKKRKPVRTGLPADFALTPELQQWLVTQGIDSEWQQQWLFQNFIDYAKSKKPLYSDWDAAFRSNVNMKLSKGDRIPEGPGAGGDPGVRRVSPIAGLASRSASALDVAARMASRDGGQAGFPFPR